MVHLTTKRKRDLLYYSNLIRKGVRGLLQNTLIDLDTIHDVVDKAAKDIRK